MKVTAQRKWGVSELHFIAQQLEATMLANKTPFEGPHEEMHLDPLMHALFHALSKGWPSP